MAEPNEADLNEALGDVLFASGRLDATLLGGAAA
jgi:hypothetical protein